MCRQNQLWGCMLLSFGLGIFVGMLLESSFFSCCFGCGLVVLGLCVVRRK